MTSRKLPAAFVVLIVFAACGVPASQENAEAVAPGVFEDLPPITAAELSARRAALMDALPGGIVLLPARSGGKSMQEPGWVQDPDFQYFTGLVEGSNAILMIDSRRRTSTLFTGPVPTMFGSPAAEAAIPEVGALQEITGIEQVLSWDTFPQVLQDLGDEGMPIYTRSTSSGPTSPPGMAPLSGSAQLWNASLHDLLADVEIRSVGSAIDSLRWAKSDAEIARLRVNAAHSAAALKAGMRAVAPGRTQREAESAVVAACLEAGSNGPSFWPWMQSGPNAHLSRLTSSFHVYDNLNRTMESGELVRADIGCMGHGYGGDVGRTVPVSGRFTAEQRLVWDHLVGAYRAGIEVMVPGVSPDDVADAAMAWLEAARADAPEGDHTALDALIQGANWHIHSIGIESAEPNADVFSEGTVIDFEPMFAYGEDAYYLEDMILITRNGAEILTSGLPTLADEIESFLD